MKIPVAFDIDVDCRNIASEMMDTFNCALDVEIGDYTVESLTEYGHYDAIRDKVLSQVIELLAKNV